MKDEQKTFNINISSLSIIKVIIFIFLIWFLWVIKSIVGILFVSLILTSAFDPFVNWMHRKRIPRVLAMLLIYLIFFGFLALVVGLLIPPIIEQTSDLANVMPGYSDKLVSLIQRSGINVSSGTIMDNIQNSLQSIQQSLTAAGGGLVSTASNIFGGITSFILVLVITFYMTVQEEPLKNIFRNIIPAEAQPYIVRTVNRMKEKIGLWLRGQLILMLIVAVLTFIGLFVFGIKYALVLALLAGILEIVPYLGPLLAAIPAVFFAFMQSPWLGLAIIVLYYMIQWVENNLLVPKIMQKVVGLNPIVSIVVLLIGAELAGFVGMILAIPTATALSVISEDFFERRKTEMGKLEE